MKPLPDRLNDRLEQQRRGQQPPLFQRNRDQDVDELARLAQRLQVTSQLQVDPRFAQRLEARIQAHHAAQSYKRTTTIQRNRPLQRTHRMPLALGIALACLLLVVIAGTLTVAAQASNPGNPLYAVKNWVQHMQNPPTSTAVTHDDVNWHKAEQQLNTLTSRTDPAHPADYQQDISALDQQINELARSIQTRPPGPDRDALSKRLKTLKAEARQTLRKLLPRLTLSEKLLTTDELGRLDDATIPRIDSVTMLVSHPNKQATITITGDHLQPGAQLIVNNQTVASSSLLQNQDGNPVFTMSWPGKQSPKTIGILNPDGTVAQTNTIAFTVTEGNSNANGNNGNNGNTNGNNGNNGNANGNNGNNGNANGNNGDNSNKNNGGNNGNANGNNNGNNGNGNGNGNGKAVATPTATP